VSKYIGLLWCVTTSPTFPADINTSLEVNVDSALVIPSIVMSKTSFGLRTPKRQTARYDLEKRPLADDDWEDADSDYTPASSRVTSYNYNNSHDHDPVLATPKSASRTNWLRTTRRKFNKYFALLLTSIIIIFIVLLVRAGRNSRWDVANNPSRPLPPPLFDKFPFLERYYGGRRSIVRRQDNDAEYPESREETLEMLRNISSNADVVERRALTELSQARPFNPFSGDIEYAAIQECFLGSSTRIPKLHAFDGVVSGFPEPVMGSYEIFGLNNDVCFDRYGKLGPYGYGYSKNFGGNGAGMVGDTKGSEAVWKEASEVDYRKVKWADAQTRCFEKNKNRFSSNRASTPTTPSVAVKRQEVDLSITTAPSERSVDEPSSQPISTQTISKTSPLQRHVVLIRTWNEYEYDEEDILYLRSMIAELGLASGGEYTVHFLVHVKDHGLPIWADEEAYQKVLDESLPAEFGGMGSLWSESQMSMMYGGLSESNYRNLPVYGVYRSTYLPVQWFAHTHPEYDFFWHWEMDIRYTGHYYHLFDRIGKWAKRQPRKGLWERNGRFYVPTEHGSFEDFRHMVRVQTEQATRMPNQKMFDDRGRPIKNIQHTKEQPIWGPQPPDLDWNDLDLTDSPKPPTTFEKDNFEWGVGEDADFITFNPLFDPDQTGWILAEDVTGYNTTAGYPPRRTAIITASRLSRRLLETMHRETAIKKHIMFSEMWPGSCALHHGLKAVYAPHPVYIDRWWPTDYLAAVFNGGKNGASGGNRMSTFEDRRQRNFLGTTWYYHAQFSERLWKRWLGFRVDDQGGPEEEMAGEGRMCLPAMLLHPIKQVDLITEHKDADGGPDRNDMEVGNAGD